MPGLGHSLSLALPGVKAVRPSFAGALDGYATGLTCAWSLARRLLTSYSGPIVRVRRGSDDTEMDIPFTPGGELDLAVLAGHAGLSSAYVVKVYDQSGVGNDLVQSTAARQLRMVNAGAVVTLGGRPCAEVIADSSQGMTTLPFTPKTSATWTVNGVFYLPADGNIRLITAPQSGSQDFVPGGFLAAAEIPEQGISTYESSLWRSILLPAYPSALAFGTRVKGDGDSLRLSTGASTTTAFTASPRDFNRWLVFQYDATNLISLAGSQFAEGAVWEADHDASLTAILAEQSAFYSLT